MVDGIETHFQRTWIRPLGCRASSRQQIRGVHSLDVPTFEAPFTPCVEIGSRLAAEYWGRSRFGDRRCEDTCQYRFEGLGLGEIVATTVPGQHAFPPCDGETRHDAHVLPMTSTIHDCPKDIRCGDMFGSVQPMLNSTHLTRRDHEISR
jgi:hypothetical protein